MSKASAIIAKGRSMPLVAEAIVVDEQPGYRPSTAAVTWRSTNPAVLRVEGTPTATEPMVTAVSPGTASLIASACEVSDSLDLLVVPAGYSIISLGDSTHPVAVNDSGSVVGSTGSGSGGSWLWRNGAFSALGGCKATDVNNASEVLCRTSGPTLWRDGAVTTLDTLQQLGVAVNDSGHVLMSAFGAPLRWLGPGEYVVIGPGVGSAAAMNNVGDVAGQQFPTLYPSGIAVLHDGTVRNLGGYGRTNGPAAMNDLGDIVGWSEYLNVVGRGTVAVYWPGAGGRSLLRAVSGPRVANDVATSAVAINNARQIVGSGSQGAFLWMNGRLGLLSYMLADANWDVLTATDINARGQVIGEARNRVTGKVAGVLISP